MTSVSIKYIGGSPLVYALEVLIPADVRHSGKNFREALAIGICPFARGLYARHAANDGAPTSEPFST